MAKIFRRPVDAIRDSQRTHRTGTEGVTTGRHGLLGKSYVVDPRTGRAHGVDDRGRVSQRPRPTK